MDPETPALKAVGREGKPLKSPNTVLSQTTSQHLPAGYKGLNSNSYESFMRAFFVCVCEELNEKKW